MMIVNVNNTDFTVDVIIKKSNRKIYLRIRDGVIKITTPMKLSKGFIEEIILKNFSYIKEYMNNNKNIEDELHYLGKKYSLIINSSLDNTINVLENDIIISTSNDNISKLVQTLYINTLKNIVEKYLNEILLRFNLDFIPTIEYKNVKGYYGVCHPHKKRIILSTRLAKYDLKYILSVIYHECAHFKYPNHQEEFYLYLEQIYPNYRIVQKELRKIKYNDKY